MLADGTTFEGELIGAEPAGGVATRRGGVQHRAVRLPGGAVRPQLRRADHHLHLPPHRQLRGQRRRRREPAAVRPGRRRARPGPAPLQLARRPATSTPTCAATACPASPGVDTRRLTRHIREAGAMPGAFGARRRGRPSRRRRPPSPAPTASTWSPPSPAPSRTRWRRGPAAATGASSPTTSASSARSCATSPGWARSRSCPAATPGRRGAGPRARRRVPVQRPGRPRRGELRRRGHPRAGRRGAGVRHLPRPPAAGHRARRHHPQAAVRPPRRQPPRAAPGHRPGRDHQPEPQLRGGRGLARPRRRGHPRQPQRRRDRGHPGRRRCGPSACSTTPRRAPAPTTPPTCSTSSPTLIDATGGGR